MADLFSNMEDQTKPLELLGQRRDSSAKQLMQTNGTTAAAVLRFCVYNRAVPFISYQYCGLLRSRPGFQRQRASRG